MSRGPGQSVAWGQSPGIEIQGRRDRLDPLGPTLVAILLRVGGTGLRGPGRGTDRGGPRRRGGDVIASFFLHGEVLRHVLHWHGPRVVLHGLGLLADLNLLVVRAGLPLDRGQRPRRPGHAGRGRECVCESCTQHLDCKF